MKDQILPKLTEGLRAYTIDGQKETSREPFRWCPRWEEQLPPGAYVALIVHELLYPWLLALRRWVAPPQGGATVDIGAVNSWYESWKEDLGPVLRAETSVQGMLDQVNARR